MISCAIKNAPLLILLISLVSCNEDGATGNAGQVSNLIPLKVGNSWVFQATIYDSTGAFSRLDTLEYRVIKDTVLNGEHWFLTTTGYYRNAADGVWFLDGDSSPILLYKDPGVIGEQYPGANNVLVDLLSRAEDKSVPQGKYSCYHYRLSTVTPTKVNTHCYLAEGVGWVYDELFAVNYARNECYVKARLALMSLTLQ